MDLITQIASFIASVISTSGILLLLITALITAKQTWWPLQVTAVLLPLLAILVTPDSAPSWLPVAATLVSVYVTLRVAHSIRPLDVGEVRRAIALRPRCPLGEVAAGLRAEGAPRTPRALAGTGHATAVSLGLTRAHTVLLAIALLPLITLGVLGHLTLLPWVAVSAAAGRFGLALMLGRFNPCSSVTEDFDDEPGHVPPSATQAPGYDTDFEEPVPAARK